MTARRRLGELKGTLGAKVRPYIEVKLLPALEPIVGFAAPPFRGRRYRARRMGSYDEWTIIYDPIVDRQTTDPDLLSLLLRAAMLAQTNSLSAVEARRSDLAVKPPIGRWPSEHYRLLSALAEVIGATTAVDIGTSTGASALALLAAPSVNEVHTFDIRQWTSYPDTLIEADDLDRGLHHHVADLGRLDTFRSHLDTLARADLVFIDGPKDGSWEYTLLRWLIEHPPAHPQLLVFDDIKVLTMVEFWRDLPLPKADATSLGHWSGTGLARRD